MSVSAQLLILINQEVENLEQIRLNRSLAGGFLRKPSVGKQARPPLCFSGQVV